MYIFVCYFTILYANISLRIFLKSDYLPLNTSRSRMDPVWKRFKFGTQRSITHIPVPHISGPTLFSGSALRSTRSTSLVFDPGVLRWGMSHVNLYLIRPYSPRLGGLSARLSLICPQTWLKHSFIHSFHFLGKYPCAILYIWKMTCTLSSPWCWMNYELHVACAVWYFVWIYCCWLPLYWNAPLFRK